MYQLPDLQELGNKILEQRRALRSTVAAVRILTDFVNEIAMNDELPKELRERARATMQDAVRKMEEGL